MIELNVSEKKTFEKIPFLDLTFGQHKVRLTGQELVIFTHYLQGKGTIRCLGLECPICKENKRLEMENPQTPKSQIRGYNFASKRHYFNVLDRTMVKVCSNPACQNEVSKDVMGRYPAKCPKCDTFMTDVEEGMSNKVKVINLSETNARSLMDYQNAIVDKKGNKLGLDNFDIVLVVTKNAQGKKDIAVLPSDPLDTTEVKHEVIAEYLYDLNRAVITLDPEEIVSLINGVALKDIFAARRGRPDAGSEAEAELNQPATEQIENLEKKWNSMFSGV